MATIYCLAVLDGFTHTETLTEPLGSMLALFAINAYLAVPLNDREHPAPFGVSTDHVGLPTRIPIQGVY